jgi:hypothetical protein
MTLYLQLYLKLMKNYQMRIILDVFFRMRDLEVLRDNFISNQENIRMRVEQFDVNMQNYYAWNSIVDSMD